MTLKIDQKGRPSIDPHGDTKAITVRLPSLLKTELDVAAERNGRSVSQEIVARIKRSDPGRRSHLVALVAAFEERIGMSYGSDFSSADAGLAATIGLHELLRAVLGRNGKSYDQKAPQIGTQVAELLVHWIETSADEEAIALRTAFTMKKAKKP